MEKHQIDFKNHHIGILADVELYVPPNECDNEDECQQDTFQYQEIFFVQYEMLNR